MNWRDVPNWPEFMVSDTGLVYWRTRFTFLCMDARNTVYLVSPEKRYWRANPGAVVLLAFVGPKPPGLCVLHYDDDPTNNILSNLRYGTRADNAQDSLRNCGRAHMVGEHCNRSELTCEQVLEAAKLKGLAPKQWTYERLGARFGVHSTTVHKALRGNNWLCIRKEVEREMRLES